MSKKQCKVAKCPGEHYARGYCQKHYRQFQREGDITDTLEMVYDILKGECTLEECEHQLFLHGLCLQHYNEITQNGVIEEIREAESCKVAHCRKPLFKDGLCGGHFEDFQYVHKVLEENMRERQLREALTQKRKDRFEKSFQKVLDDPEFPLNKEGRGTYVLEGAAIEGVDNARKLYRFLRNNGIELKTLQP